MTHHYEKYFIIPLSIFFGILLLIPVTLALFIDNFVLKIIAIISESIILLFFGAYGFVLRENEDLKKKIKINDIDNSLMQLFMKF